MILLFTRCSIPSILELLSAKVYSSLSSNIFFKLLFLLAKSRAIAASSFCVSALNNDILSSLCCSFSEKLVSREFCRFSTELSNVDNLSLLFFRSISKFDNFSSVFFSSVSNFRLSEENLCSTVAISNRRELLSSFSSS